MKKEPTWLIVWPDWNSSGIWQRSEKGGLQMVSHESLNLPQRLSKKFDDWIDWYDEYQPEKRDEFPWEEFRNAGTILALELSSIMPAGYKIEYESHEVISLS